MNAYIIFQERDPKYANHVQAKYNNDHTPQLGQPGTQTQEHAPHCRRQDIEEIKTRLNPKTKATPCVNVTQRFWPFDSPPTARPLK